MSPRATMHVTAKSLMRPGSIVFIQHAIESDGEPFRLFHGLQNTRRGTEGVT
jgi:hypothetical protein